MSRPEWGGVPENLLARFMGFEKFIMPAMPSAFDTKNLGVTLDRDSKQLEKILVE